MINRVQRSRGAWLVPLLVLMVAAGGCDDDEVEGVPGEMPDMSGVADMESSPDLAGDADLGTLPDLVEATDLGVTPDLAEAGDMGAAPVGERRGHEPAGFVRITERHFDAMNEDGWSDGDAGSDDPVAQTFTIGADRSAPVSPDGVGVITFPAGHPGSGSSSRTARSVYAFPEAITSGQVYIEFYLKLSDNWHGHTGSAVNKVFYVGHPIVIDAHGVADGPLHLRVALQGGETANLDFDSAENEVQPAAAQAELVRGQWQHIELLFDVGTLGGRDGEAHAWVNGVKTHQFTGRAILPATGMYAQIQMLDWHPIYGGQGGEATPAEQTQTIDAIYVSRGP